MMVTVFQASVTAIPIEDKTVISAVLLFLAIALAAAKQAVSVEVNSRNAKWATIIVLVIAIIGGINEAGLIDIAKFSEKTSQWIRVGLTLLVAMLDQASKTFFPTHEAKVIEAEKAKLAS
jgi:VanZ family protein